MSEAMKESVSGEAMKESVSGEAMKENVSGEAIKESVSGEAMKESVSSEAMKESVSGGKDRVRNRLLQLMKESKDPYYDKYLAQMLKDLESAKATPGQVEREIERTCRLYQERMAQARGETIRPDSSGKSAVEFKIGAGLFSIIGAVFVLSAFIILGFNFLNSLWQGIGLYVISLAALLASELLIKRVNKKISILITGIGLGSLYISTIINYLELKTLNGAAAVGMILLTSLLAVFVSYKRDSAFVRLISIIGCYISVWPVKGFETELDFMVVTAALLIINMVNALFPNRKNQRIINFIHMLLSTLFLIIFLGAAGVAHIGSGYIILFLITNLIFLNTAFWKEKGDVKPWYTVFFCIEIGICLWFLLFVDNISGALGISLGEALFNRILAEALVLATAAVFFILWGKDRLGFIQYYFAAIAIAGISFLGDSVYERCLPILIIFMVTRLLSSVKELTALDCILAVWAAVASLVALDSWMVWLFAGVFLISAVKIKDKHLFHEIVITFFLLITGMFKLRSGWAMAVCPALLLLLFFLFNHLPNLKVKKQNAYNLVNVITAGIFYLFTWLANDYRISLAAMVIGAAAILIMFRERYCLKLSKKYLLLAGFLTYMIITAGFKTSVTVSILLMIIALSCVGIGFKIKDKAQRICGLIMAILVCLKLVLYDFRELEALPRAVLFLVIGILALVISFIYIYLEKKEDKQEKLEKQETFDGGEKPTDDGGEKPTDKTVINKEAISEVSGEADPGKEALAEQEGEREIKAEAMPSGIGEAEAEPEGETEQK